MRESVINGGNVSEFREQSLAAAGARGWHNVNVREAAILMGADAEAVSAELFDKEINEFSIDSRSVKTGELFFALSQEDYARAGFNGTFDDAHQYIKDAFDKGAIAAVARADRVNGDPRLWL